MKKILLYTLYAVIIIINVLNIALHVADVKIEHFEDGSGRITYCLPFEDAGAYWGGCN